uniref:Rano class II histocompatibility antigen, A beta chain-like n=1 Tax=Pundamilia nyererei TaxID=303518 RepID=A0A3B4H104_9CICH
TVLSFIAYKNLLFSFHDEGTTAWISNRCVMAFLYGFKNSLNQLQVKFYTSFYIYLNKMLLGQYNSTLGKYVGYTEKTKEIADNLNKNKGFLEHEKKNKEKCRTNIPLVLDILSRPGNDCRNLFIKWAERSVQIISLVKNSKHPGLFMCSAYNFYPKQIKLTWLRDGKEATSNVTSTDELPNGNWLYQIHSYIEISSKPGEKISCVVEHASLTEPKVYDWVPITEAGRNKIAVGAAGLLLALVFPIIGVIFYKRKATGETHKQKKKLERQNLKL